VRTFRTIVELRAALEPLRGRSTIGLVPTMGAYHDGHLSLFRAARAECDVVVVSLFVNPAQFAPHEGLASYPRDEEADAAIAAESGVDLLFAPAPEELYPPGFGTWVEVDDELTGAEGAARPGHFRGVATVCLKLFNVVRPDIAYFGQKDARQAAIVRRVVRDLNVELDVRVLPTVRAGDGLALSSRNTSLSPDERREALALPRALEAGAAAFRAGGDPVGAARAAFDGLVPDYVELAELDGNLVLAAALRVGRTRLIDNVVLEGERDDA
jgi:pantoate--beta-alanine ligase